MYSQKPLLHKKQREYKGGLRTLSIDVTNECNMNCAHCYASTFKSRLMLDYRYFKKAIREFQSLGGFHFILQGGEPIISSRLWDILGAIDIPSSYVNLVSNGWDMHGGKVAWAKGIGIDKIAFSLDSGLASEHDKFRQEGSFERVIEGANRVIEHGLLTSFSCVVTHESLRSNGFKLLLDFAYSKKIRVDAQIAMPVGKWDGREDILITEEDAKYIKELRESYGKLPNGQWMINRDIYNFGGEDHCPAAVEFLAITSDGSIQPCNFCQFSYGNIEQDSIKNARAKMMKSKWFQGKVTRCLLGEDREFFSKFVKPYTKDVKPLKGSVINE